jgi:hypothetical protein
MKPRTLLILLLLVAGLAAFAWFVDRDQPGSDERKEQAGKVLRFDGEQVAALVIEHDGETVRLEGARPAADAAASEEGSSHEGAPDEEAAEEGATNGSQKPRRWRLVAPLTANADGDLVRSLLSDLGALESQREVAGDEIGADDRAQFGLDAPRARVTLERDGEPPLTLAVGAAVPSSDSMLVAVAGEEAVHVVSDRLLDALSRAPGDWRDRALFDGERAAIERVRLEKSGATPVVLARGSAGQGADFWIESPFVDRAQRDQVDRLLSDLAGLRAERFVDQASDSESGTGWGLEPPAGVVEVAFDGAQPPWTLEIGAATGEGAGQRYARVAGPEGPGPAGSGPLVEIGAALAQRLELAPVDWRSKAWSTLEVWQVDAVRLQDGEGTLELHRDSTDWRRGDERIPFTPVSDLLAALTGVEAEQFGTGAPAGEPTLTVELTGSEGRHETLKLYPADGDFAPATVSDREVTLLLPADAVAAITEATAAVRAAEPLPEDEEAGVAGVDAK